MPARKTVARKSAARKSAREEKTATAKSPAPTYNRDVGRDGNTNRQR